MASPPPQAIAAVTGNDRLLARAIWEIEHVTGPRGREEFAAWSSSHYGLSDAASRRLWDYVDRIQGLGTRLENSAASIPRRRQARNPDIATAYRVRVYARIGGEEPTDQRHIPITLDLAYNPTNADVEREVRAWWSRHYRTYQANRYRNDRRSNLLQGHTIRSLECRTC